MEKTTAEHGDGKPAPEIKTTDLDQTTVLIAFFVVLITCVLLYIFRKKRAARTDFLLTGVCDSGKTLLFSQLVINKGRETFTSISENIGWYQCGRGSVKVLDLPGHERLRSKFFDKYKSQAKGIVYVVDSATLQKDVRDVADYLYTILADNATSSSAILILCNKQDEPLAKGSAVIKALLEKELNVIRSTRASKLESVDSSRDSTNSFLGKQGKDFEFAHLPQNVQILESSAKKNELNHLRDWIDRIV